MQGALPQFASPCSSATQLKKCHCGQELSLQACLICACFLASLCCSAEWQGQCFKTWWGWKLGLWRPTPSPTSSPTGLPLLPPLLSWVVGGSDLKAGGCGSQAVEPGLGSYTYGGFPQAWPESQAWGKSP